MLTPEEQDIRSQLSEAALFEQLAEEATELSHVSQKMARKLRNENPTPMTLDELSKALCEEYNDVMLVSILLHLEDRLSKDFMLKKLDRWRNRLKEKST